MSFYNREPEVHEWILPVRPGVSLLSHRLLLPLLIGGFGIIVGVWKCLLTKRLVLINDFPSNGCKLDCYCRFWSIIYTNLSCADILFSCFSALQRHSVGQKTSTHWEGIYRRFAWAFSYNILLELLFKQSIVLTRILE